MHYIRRRGIRHLILHLWRGNHKFQGNVWTNYFARLPNHNTVCDKASLFYMLPILQYCNILELRVDRKVYLPAKCPHILGRLHE